MNRRSVIAFIISYLLVWALSDAWQFLGSPRFSAIDLSKHQALHPEGEIALGSRPSFFRLREDELALIPGLKINQVAALLAARLDMCISLLLLEKPLDEVLLQIHGIGPKTREILKQELSFPVKDCLLGFLRQEEEVE